MSTKNRVIWSEGLFIKPQHFQQMQRNLEYIIDSRMSSVMTNFFGLSSLQINQAHLSFGKITIESTIGIMPDGVEFNMPIHDVLPEPLEITETQVGNQLVYLAIPELNDARLEISEDKAEGRLFKKTQFVRDLHTEEGDLTELNIAPVKLRLMLESEDRSAYSSIAIAKIKEKKPAGPVILYDDYIPCHLNSINLPVISGYLYELEGVVRTRAQNISKRIGSPQQSGVADVSDFLLLQILNTMHGELQHLTHCEHLHPEHFYMFMVRYCSHLFTFTNNNRLAPIFEAYNHVLPDFSLKGCMGLLRRALSTELDSKAISIPLVKKAHGLNIAPLADKSLLQDAEFILAIRADLNNQELRKYFIQQTKVATIEKINERVSLQLPGISLLSLPVTPRQLPYHADYIYFRLDKTHSSWQELHASSGFAFHISGHFPNLSMSFWAIRE